MIAADEFKEDIQTGDEVRIVTQTEQFEGRVTRIRTTTIKLETAGTEQTISFDAMESGSDRHGLWLFTGCYQTGDRQLSAGYRY